MLKQINLREAVQLLEEGKRVPCLVPHGEDWTDYQSGFLNDYLDGIIILSNTEKTCAGATGGREKASKSKKTRPKVEVDMGKVHALLDAGRSVKWIADDMGIAEQTVRNRLKEEENEQG